jgi:hypothetical protein
MAEQARILCAKITLLLPRFFKLAGWIAFLIFQSTFA